MSLQLCVFSVLGMYTDFWLSFTVYCFKFQALNIDKCLLTVHHQWLVRGNQCDWHWLTLLSFHCCLECFEDFASQTFSFLRFSFGVSSCDAEMLSFLPTCTLRSVFRVVRTPGCWFFFRKVARLWVQEKFLADLSILRTYEASTSERSCKPKCFSCSRSASKQNTCKLWVAGSTAPGVHCRFHGIHTSEARSMILPRAATETTGVLQLGTFEMML
jgi:hypothetical protein